MMVWINVDFVDYPETTLAKFVTDFVERDGYNYLVFELPMLWSSLVVIEFVRNEATLPREQVSKLLTVYLFGTLYLREGQVNILVFVFHIVHQVVQASQR